ncbi:hypothetical protein J6590_089178 [Homalodisca vitripennis]|nr:hypothetical protein J6590_089178 [Homalodisca vitripennis]
MLQNRCSQKESEKTRSSTVRNVRDSQKRVGVHCVCATLYRPLITTQRKAHEYCHANTELSRVVAAASAPRLLPVTLSRARQSRCIVAVG